MNSVKCLARYLSLRISLLIITGHLVISGCATTQPTEPVEPVADNGADAIIAQDFINIMVQIEQLSPTSTVLRFGLEEGNPSENDTRSIETNNAFGKGLRAAAAKSGYAIETVGSPTGDNYISYAIAEFGDAVDGTTYTYDVSVGNIDLRRVYKPLEDGGIEPFESMLVRGVDVSQLETDDSIFNKAGSDKTSSDQAAIAAPEATVTVPDNDQQSNNSQQPAEAAVDTNSVAKSEAAAVEQQPAEQQPTEQQPDAVIIERPVTIAAPLISDLPDNSFDKATDTANEETSTVAQSLVGGNLPSGFETVSKLNVAVSGESNYENLLADKTDVVEEILIFGDDSYVLGPRNKEILGNMMGKFNPETDVVSVVGCSTGVTKIENGNAALAIGRANRVKEALLYSGIPHDKIFDEGCWSPVANSTPFPNRGVVVTVKRNAGNG